ncbi:MAG: SDR family NAD(P)-dependent oxidoreductase [Acidobacteria bacterium]|nr:SDR family NAD(P)-dependent oxidoreductase [Acidobacteriota bacterium]MBI3657909.1 SDR family NAD(P)-dependent oxidoreductase [Acidobacteriota bacterium]
MKYLITGGSGFIGSHLADRLLEQGHTVLVVDDLTTGSIENIQHLKNHARFQYVIDSVMNEPLLAELIDCVDGVFHLAAVVGVRLVVDEPIRTIQTNIHCTELVLKHAGKKGKKVLITSTSEVYGKSAQVPYSEDDALVYGPTTKSRWSYAYSKAIDEFLALAYYKTRGLPIIITRLFNTVGPRQTGHYGMVLPRFVQQALAGGPITVYGDGHQMRCFCHVTDVTRALAQLMESPDALGEIFNLGSDKETTILQLAKMVRARINPTIGIRYVAYEQAYGAGFDDMQRRQPNTAKIHKAIGFKPEFQLDQIIDDVAQHMGAGLSSHVAEAGSGAYMTGRRPLNVSAQG